MNFNKLLYRHQMAILRAQRASTDSDRETHLNRAGEFAGQIADWRTARNLSNTGWPKDRRSAAPVFP